MDLNTILRVGALKIKCAKEDTIKGSGFAYLPKSESNYLYVLTAKHCIYGVDFKLKIKEEDLKIEFFRNDKKEYQSYILKPKTDEIIEFGNKEDFAIIKIPKSNLDESLISNIQPVEIINSKIFGKLREKEINLNFYGFPNFRHDRGIGGDAKLKDYDYSNHRFDIKLEDEAKYKDVQGWSGSGIVCKLDKVYYLCGILLTFKEGKSLPRFAGRSFDNINELLKQKGIPEIKYAKINKKEKIKLKDKEAKARNKYLNSIKKDIENRLKVSIHNARFIDLGIDDSPSATHLPWLYEDSYSAQKFNNINDAFVDFEGRMLLLGEPGSGKTTTLLHIAQKLVNKALSDSDQAIPLIVNLSKLKLNNSQGFNISFFKKQNSDSKPDKKKVEEWLVTEFTRYPGITKKRAKKWITESRVAVFFDGLDEVDDLYRKELVQLLNETYLNDYDDSITIVCSRINEYMLLQGQKETRLQLNGAITLQALSSDQIDDYLKEAKASKLLESLPNDKALNEMARTPLTLSMMVLAYGDSAPSDFDKSLTFTERRHKLMEAYVNKMLQRKARRDHNIPFDEIEDNDIPIDDYDYSPKKVNKYLGWLAVRMSVRMQTAFSFDTFYSFLMNNMERDVYSAAWWSAALSRGILLFLFLIFSAFTIGPMTVDALLIKLSFAVIAVILTVIGIWTTLKNKDKVIEFKKTRYFIKIVFVSVFTISILGVGSVAISDIIQLNILPFPTGIITICFGLLIIVFFSIITKNKLNKNEILFFITSIAIFIIPFCLRKMISYEISLWYLAAVLLFSYQVFFLIVTIWFEDREWIPVLLIILVGGWIVVLLNLGIWLVSPLEWYDALILLSLAGVAKCSLEENPLLYLCLLISFFVFGGCFYNIQGAAIGIVIVGYTAIICNMLIANSDNLKYHYESVCNWFKTRESLYFLSPILIKILGVINYQPIYLTRFYGYTEDALLLKKSVDDYEFMHRMLRDYFALREIQPNLHHNEMKVKLEAIRSLGFQGDAGIDALIEFSRNANAQIRKAAIWAFGRIASPVVLPYIKLAIKDDSPMVRCETIHSARNKGFEYFEGVLNKLANDQDESVQYLWLETILNIGKVYPYAKRNIFLERKAYTLLKNNDDFLRFISTFITDKQRSSIQRRNAIWFVGELKASFTVPLLIDILKNNYNIYKAEAVIALGEIGDSRAIPHLKRAFKDKDKDIRRAAKKALAQFNTMNK